jgi:DNA-binding transcriptional ArsR family regulator
MSEPDSALIKECLDLAIRWAPTLKALAHPERLLIALWLADNAATVRELERVTGLQQSLVSYHLRELRDAGLVTSTASGRANVYRLANPDLNALAVLLGKDC